MAFKRLLPGSLPEALELHAQYGNRCKIIAGGTDLVVQIKKGFQIPEVLISLEKVSELRFLGFDRDSGLNIGSLATAAMIENSRLVQKNAPILGTAAASLGNPLIRRNATIGGNLCNASPSADFAPACLALGAKLKLVSTFGERVLEAGDFFQGPKKNALKLGEILARVIIPPMPENSHAVYLKASRSKGADLALVGVAVMTELADGIIKDIRIALGAVAATPIRASQTEAAFKGKKWQPGLLDDICRQSASEACCISDVRCTADYREKLIPVLIKRAVTQSVQAVQ